MGVKVKRVNRPPSNDGVLERLGVNTAVICCIVLFLVGVSSVAFLRYKRRRKLQLTTRVPTRSGRILQGSLKAPPARVTYGRAATKPFTDYLPPPTYEEARRTSYIFLVPTTEEDRIRASRSSTVSFIKQLPYGAPQPPNAIPLFMERHDRPFWNYSNVTDRGVPPTSTQTSTVVRDTKANHDTVAIPSTVSKPQVAAVPNATALTKQGQDSSSSVAPKAPVSRIAPTSKQSLSTSVVALPGTSSVAQAGPSGNTQVEPANAGRLIFSRNQPTRKTVKPALQNVQRSSAGNSARAMAKLPETGTETLEDRLEAMKDVTMQCLEALAQLSKKAQTLQAARKSTSKD